jgi:hypothetical protein
VSLVKIVLARAILFFKAKMTFSLVSACFPIHIKFGKEGIQKDSSYDCQARESRHNDITATAPLA